MTGIFHVLFVRKVEIEECFVNNCRSYLGVMAQYYLNGKLVVRTLGVRKFSLSHSEIYIAVMIKDVLESYGISVDQIYSISADNGGNMIKAIKVFRVMQSHTLDAYFDDYALYLETDDHTIHEKVIDAELKCREQIETEFNAAFIIHCAAHTAELGVKNSLKEYSETNNVLDQAHALVVELRVENIVLLLEKNNLAKPPLDVVTRWTSKHKMVCSIFFSFLMKFS